MTIVYGSYTRDSVLTFRSFRWKWDVFEAAEFQNDTCDAFLESIAPLLPSDAAYCSSRTVERFTVTCSYSLSKVGIKGKLTQSKPLIYRWLALDSHFQEAKCVQQVATVQAPGKRTNARIAAPGQCCNHNSTPDHQDPRWRFVLETKYVSGSPCSVLHYFRSAAPVFCRIQMNPAPQPLVVQGRTTTLAWSSPGICPRISDDPQDSGIIKVNIIQPKKSENLIESTVCRNANWKLFPVIDISSYQLTRTAYCGRNIEFT